MKWVTLGKITHRLAKEHIDSHKNNTESKDF